MRRGRAMCAGEKRFRAGGTVGLVTLLAVSGLLVAWTPAASAASQPSPESRTADVTLSMDPVPLRVPSSFLGVSVEYNELPNYEVWFSSFVRMLATLRSPGVHAPVILRIGGESADSSIWGPDQSAFVAPRYQQGRPYELTPAWMKGLGALVKAAAVKVILDLNLAAHSPKMAATEISSARHSLPAHSIRAIEIGNEPDNYTRAYVGYTRARPGGPSDWAFHFTIGDYTSLFGAYVRAVRRVFPRAVFAGPSGADRSPQWTNALLASPAGRHVSLVTVHAYPPLRACVPPDDPHRPTVAVYLKDWVAAGVATSLRYVLGASRTARRSLRLTEVGSSTCGGLPGKTDTFATALWAPDLLFGLLASGINGVNIHMRGNGYPNSALLYTSSGIYPEPMFYGMALFARMLGPAATLMRADATGAPHRLKIWAVHLRDGSVRVLYDNKSKYDTTALLRSSSTRPALLERLKAPSVDADQPVTLAGQRLGTDGRWHGSLAARSVPAHAGDYQVRVPAYSAAMLSVPAS
jgi:hypothetical protein